jgi:hypothetical protein
MMKNRTRQLVAWTDHGQVRMVPSLVARFAQPLLDRIAEIESRLPCGFQQQPRYLTELSRAYEDLGRCYERLDHIREAFDAYVAAADTVTNVDDFWWCDCDEGFLLSNPFRGRFFAMFAECRRLFRKYPALKDAASFEELIHDYKYVSAVTDIWHAELIEAMETSRAWRFGA